MLQYYSDLKGEALSQLPINIACDLHEGKEDSLESGTHEGIGKHVSQAMTSPGGGRGSKRHGIPWTARPGRVTWGRRGKAVRPREPT